MEKLRFLKAYAFPVGLTLLAALFVGLDMIGRYHEIMGMPSLAWEAIAAALFVAAIILFFYQVHRRLENARSPDSGTAHAGQALSLAAEMSALPLQAHYGEDHDKLLQFIVMALEPACYNLSRLQTRIVEQIDGHPKLKELAKEGLLATPAGALFDAALRKFSGLSCSPPEPMTLLDMIAVISDLEQGEYRNFGRQLQDLEKAAKFNPETDQRTATDWNDWAASHERLVAAFEVIKMTSAFDTRRYGNGLPSLYRPERKSRWGEPYDFRYDPN